MSCLRLSSAPMPSCVRAAATRSTPGCTQIQLLPEKVRWELVRVRIYQP
jgi:hypothetical protein